MDELELVRQTTTQATAYSFRFEWGWAIFTLNDATGELSIHSDWGTYGHRWHIDALPKGHSLTTFLAGTNGHYVTGKLQSDTRSKELEDDFDVANSLKDIKESILDARRERHITAQYARELVEAADEWAKEFSLRIEDCPEELSAHLCEPWEYLRYRKSARWLFIQDKLWPFFTAWLRDNVVNKPTGDAVAHG